MSRWPFLVARGRRVGYRVVLAPEFLVRARQHHLLAEHVGAGPAGPGGDSVVELPSPEFGPLVVTYREEPAAAAELVGGSGPDTLRDRHGRPLELLYGVVTGSPPAPVDDHDLARARAAAIEAYRRFLADEEGADVLPSPAFTLDAAPPQPKVAAVARQEQLVPSRQPPPPDVQRGRPWIAIVAALAALAVLAVVVVAVLFGGRLMDGDGNPDGGTVTVTHSEDPPSAPRPSGPTRRRAVSLVERPPPNGIARRSTCPPSGFVTARVVADEGQTSSASEPHRSRAC